MTDFPCISCSRECITDTIQCNECQRWVHRECVPLTPAQLSVWSSSSLCFLCRHCCFTADQFDSIKSLARVKTASQKSLRDLKAAVRSEQMLLTTYSVSLPPYDDSVAMPCDSVSKDILTLYHPALLLEVSPVSTTGDGNCMYRAMSRCLTDSESFHALLRVLTVVELVTNHFHYDSSSKKHIDLICDNRIVVSPFHQLVKDTVTPGAYAEMMHIYALSSAIGQPIRSYYPPQLSSEFLSEPFTRKVVGRGVQKSAPPVGTIMWTQMNLTDTFNPNHFVPLVRNCTQTIVPPIEVTDDSDVQVSIDDQSHSVYLDTQMNCDESEVDVAFSENHISAISSTPNKSVSNESVSAITPNKSVSNESDDTETQDSVSKALGSLTKDFLDVSTLVNLIKNANGDALDSIPFGPKENVYYLLNLKTNSNGKRDFSDDCGVWDSSKGSSPKTSYLVRDNGSLEKLFVKQNLYCKEKRNKGGKRNYEPLEPQPDPQNVVEIQRYYANLKLDKTYRKRVTWCNKGGPENRAIVEYLGTFPGLAAHGNAKKKTEYVRTPVFVMNEMSEQLKSKKPQHVYNDLTNKYDELTGPTSQRQVRDKKRYDETKNRRTRDGHVPNRCNIADHIAELDRLVTDGQSCVRSIIRDQHKAPCIILYTDEQLDDLKKICCTGRSILSVDKTFNLSNMHVTPTCYKQTSVVSERTVEAPLFFGPTFIHDNSDFESYSNFFNHLRVKLIDTDTSRLVIGSDEEGSIVKAVTSAFPDATHVLCTRHLRQNAKQQLSDKAVDKTDRDRILNLIFGQDGLIDADDSVCFDEKCDEIRTECQTVSSDFLKYFDKRLENNIRTKVSEPKIAGLLDRQWTNNNSESLNHVLKQAVEWKSQPLLDLVTRLTNLFDTQFKDLRRAIVSTGQYRLADTHTHFAISKSAWAAKTTDERKRLYKRFRNFEPKDSKTITSTDGQTTVVAPRKNGKKIGQVKRKINERTTTVKKAKC